MNKTVEIDSFLSTEDLKYQGLLTPLRNSKSPISLSEFRKIAAVSHGVGKAAIFSMTIAFAGALVITFFLLSPNDSLLNHSKQSAHENLVSSNDRAISSPIKSSEENHEHGASSMRKSDIRTASSKSLNLGLARSKEDNINSGGHSKEVIGQRAMNLDNQVISNDTNASSKVAPIHGAIDAMTTIQHIATSRPLALESKDRVYGALQYGTIMGAINSFGGGFAVTGSHDWMQATFRYTGTFGTTSSELFFQPVGRTGSQKVSEYALMFGARLEQENFWASIEAGPNVIHASFNTYFSYPKNDTISNDIGGGLGASAEATFGYKFSDYWGMELTGFVSNHTITYGGFMLSLVAGKLN